MRRSHITGEYYATEYCCDRVTKVWPGGVAKTVAERPAAVLNQNTPNPFNPTTVISYVLPWPSMVKLIVVNALGQRVRVLVDGQMDYGPHSVVWDGRDEQGKEVASGVYLYRLETPGAVQTKKMVLLR